MSAKYVIFAGLAIGFASLLIGGYFNPNGTTAYALVILFHIGLLVTGLGLFAYLDEETDKWY